MKSMKKERACCLLSTAFVFAIFLFSGCSPSTPDYAGDDAISVISGDIALVKDFFVEAINSETGETVTSFRMNDAKYWSESGYTLWTVWDDDPGAVDFSRRFVRLSKSDGDQSAGYGIVICQRDVDGIGKCMLTVLINTEGYYAIGKAINAKYEAIHSWERSALLKTGYGAGNTIEVTYEKSSKEFALLFNGGFVRYFRDDDEPVLTGGNNGYIVVVSPQDDFPDEYIDLKFFETR